MKSKSAVNALWLGLSMFVYASYASEIEDFRSATGMGQFDAQQHADHLEVTLNVFFEFRPGSPVSAPGYATREYRWQSNDKRDFKKRFEQQIEETWSKQYQLLSPDGTSRLEVVVDVKETKALAAATWKVLAHGYPDDAVDTDVSLCDFGFRHYGSDTVCVRNDSSNQWGTIRIGRHQLQPVATAEPLFQPISFAFERGKSQFNGHTDQAMLEDDRILQLIVEGVRDHGWWLILDGYAGGHEDDVGTAPGREIASIRIARQRLATVQQYLTGKGLAAQRMSRFAVGEFVKADAAAASEDFGVTVSIAPYASLSAAHEAGHMFGLPDESPLAIDAGSYGLSGPYKALVMWYLNEKVEPIDEDNIMSLGAEVKARHYVPFAEAIEAITGKTGWGIVDYEQAPQRVSPEAH